MDKILAGYKQVESFGHDEDYEDGIEEIYVTMDLGNVDPTLLPSSSTYRLIVCALEIWNYFKWILMLAGFR